MNEIGLSSSEYNGEAPLYFIAERGCGKPSGIYANASTLALEAENDSNWPNYAIPMPVATDGNYYGSFPAVPDGDYTIYIYQQAGGTPAFTDQQITEGNFEWVSSTIALSGNDYSNANPLYFVAQQMLLDNPTGMYANASTMALEAQNNTNWTNYAIPMPLASDGNYYGIFPAFPAGNYEVYIYQQLGGSPASTDTLIVSNNWPWNAGPSTGPNQLQLDAVGMMDFAEPVIYRQWVADDTQNGTFNSLIINAVVNRNPQEAITEDGRTLTDSVEVCILNAATIGVTSVTPKRDKINVSGRYGGPATEHIVTMVMSGDAAFWTLRVK